MLTPFFLAAAVFSTLINLFPWLFLLAGCVLLVLTVRAELQAPPANRPLGFEAQDDQFTHEPVTLGMIARDVDKVVRSKLLPGSN